MVIASCRVLTQEAWLRAIRVLMELADEIQRSLLGLHINPTHILTKQADADQLETAEKQNCYEQRSIARDINALDESSQHNEAGIEKSYSRNETASVSAQPQWLDAKTGQALKREV